MSRETESGVVRIVVVGLGHQSVDDHIPAIVESSFLDLAAVVDIDSIKARAIGGQFGVPYATTLDEALQQLSEPAAVALIAVPHSGHVEIVEQAAASGLHIIKEKPFATSADEAARIACIVARYNSSLQVTLQRRFNPIFKSFSQLKKRIGRIHSFEARYTLNVERLDEGWRASRLYAGGGALIDLGYHYVDLIVWYFGLPDRVVCTLSTGNRERQIYDVEDTALVHVSYSANREAELIGSLIVSRVYPDKDEALVAYGTRGSASVQRGRAVRRDLGGEVIECLERSGSWPSALVDQLEEFAANIASGRITGAVDEQYLAQVAFVEAAYRSAESGKAENPQEILAELVSTITAETASR